MSEQINLQNLPDIHGKILAKYPKCVKNRLRGIILLCIDLFQPITRQGLIHLGFSKGIVRSFIRSSRNEGLVIESLGLLKLSSEGTEVLMDILYDPILASWYHRQKNSTVTRK
ncbi:MAG: hypothetical protein INQ03_22575 [Candidatus Heimdallarchaeota archaeon]|nr:hypothetical protein [Candidatus Heimdallarchaeota archaeon]